MALRAACTGFLDPFARALGPDGVLLMALAPEFPAYEIALPAAITAYMQQGGAAALPCSESRSAARFKRTDTCNGGA